MIALIIATHGSFSKELVKSAELIYGSLSDVSCVSFLPGEGHSDLLNKYNTIINTLDTDCKILFMVDLFGGSPYNTASMLALNNVNIDVVTGVNLPMLLDVYTKKEDSSLNELVNISESSGINSIRSLKKSLIINEGEDLL